MISVAIPTYNGEIYLESALKSIIKHTYKVQKIIISDDASSDNTSQLIEKLQKKYHMVDIAYFKNKENLGYQKNWNKCFEYCNTKYLNILHQDDLLKDHSLRNVFCKSVKIHNLPFQWVYLLI